YKVDGFRFDLMGHHMKRNLEAARDALRALTLAEHGVDGSSIYLYGEGWDFGEVQGGQRGVNASQIPMAGTGIGTFNDRIRDAVRGGNPFGDRREQGVATGLHVQPSRWSAASGPRGAADLRAQLDRTRTGMAGNLRERGGYNADPQENVVYVSAHDNETLFDKIQFAASEDAPLAQRIRMQGLAHGIVALSQGVPFFHAGSELLRSKSMDRDSYDSGDWFNRLDFTAETNNWGVGLPIADKNQERWEIIGPLLADPTLRPTPEQIRGVRDQFLDWLRIRRSSPLFRLRTAEEINGRVRFLNDVPDGPPGVIVMSLADDGDGLADLDPEARRIVVVFNATPDPVRWSRPAWRGEPLQLHPVQAAGADPAARNAAWNPDRGELSVPAWTAAVFRQPQE
ncbi:MAG: DUF3372 domain-containing protein, partial [Gemmatimonadetes bacterium]|nr:DUF3372 domain-containing protein [Gemmatimonadota bacterium]